MWKRLDPKISTSEKHSKLGFSSITLWVMMLPHTDSKGRYWANPTFIIGQCLPLFDHVRPEQIEAALLDLQKAGLIHLYDVGDGKRYLVFHDVEDFNPPGSLRYQKTSWPTPPEAVCRCVSRRESAVPTIVVSSSSSYSSSSQERRGGVGERRVANALAELWNDGPGEHLNGKSAVDKIQAAIDVGVDPQVIEQHFWDHQRIKGRKIWEVLDPLRPKDGAAICSIQDVINEVGAKLAKEEKLKRGAM
jgi:hypothetical protein